MRTRADWRLQKLRQLEELQENGNGMERSTVNTVSTVSRVSRVKSQSLEVVHSDLRVQCASCCLFHCSPLTAHYLLLTVSSNSLRKTIILAINSTLFHCRLSPPNGSA